MTAGRPEGRGDAAPEDRSVGELVFDVSERVSLLVREEIELAKAEVSEKLSKLARGGAIGVVAGVFVLLGVAMAIHAIAWLLNDYLFPDHVWIGFAIEAVFWFAIAAVAGLVAYRSLRAGAPPTPELAIEEAKRTKETLTGSAQETSGSP